MTRMQRRHCAKSEEGRTHPHGIIKSALTVLDDPLPLGDPGGPLLSRRVGARRSCGVMNIERRPLSSLSSPRWDWDAG